MSTQKPRIQAYVQSELYQAFERERSQWGISQSQALERVLSERYQEASNTTQIEHQLINNDDLHWIKVSLGNIRERLTRLEIANNLDDEVAIEIDNDLPILSNLESVSESKLVTSESDGSLPSESELVTSDSDGGLPSELGLVTGESDSSLPSELELVTGESDGEVVTGKLITKLTKNAIRSLSDSPLELNKFVICEIDKEIGRFTYWTGSKNGFTSSLEAAKRYKSEAMAERAKKGILEDPSYSRFSEARFDLKYNPVRYFIENPAPKSKERVSV